MELSAIAHRCGYTGCYALDENEIVVNLRTGKDVTAVFLIHEDPYAGGCMGYRPWEGRPEAMTLRWELAHNFLWSIRLRPKFKREQYYFCIQAREETMLLFEDGFYTREQADKPGRLRQYFKFPWLNPADVIRPPAWAGDTVWYQIMPDRFRKGDEGPRRFPLKPWNAWEDMTHGEFYGGDLRGIQEKLPYLRDLGINGIYLTPVFLSDSNHKYDTISYDRIDPDLGTEEELVQLVRTAHSLGIRVMLDAVFNHCGARFGPWLDVLEKGPDSPFWDWFFVKQWPLPETKSNTEDGRFYSFAFVPQMPKLNTNNREVAEYFFRRCAHWVRDWQIDGIRFDVGNEVSHQFLKRLHGGLKAINPEIFLLGEIWHDSAQWLQGDEYDSVMNYPFLESLHNFYLDGQSSRELMYAMNRIYTMYPRQVGDVLFHFLDTHDTMRALTRCGSKDIFYQQLVFLLTMPGSACLYYGTEIALAGGDDPRNRRPMPWDQVETEEGRAQRQAVSRLIGLRRQYPQLRRGCMAWKHVPQRPRYVRVDRYVEGEDTRIAVCLNAGDSPVSLPEGKRLFSRQEAQGLLLPGGSAVILLEAASWK